jgi:hypothetical protein
MRMWAGLVAVALAIASYFAFEPSVPALLMNVAELAGVLGLFSLVCLAEASS